MAGGPRIVTTAHVEYHSCSCEYCEHRNQVMMDARYQAFCCSGSLEPADYGPMEPRMALAEHLWETHSVSVNWAEIPFETPKICTACGGRALPRNADCKVCDNQRYTLDGRVLE